MSTVRSSEGIDLALHDLGGTGPVALLAHATGFHGLVWEPFAASLRGVHAWAPDLRGHGDSPVPPDHVFEWAKFADDVLACLDHLDAGHLTGDDRPVGIGHSKGGAALLLAEQRRPGTFRALWCYEPVVFPPDLVQTVGSDNPLSSGARRRRANFPSVDAAFDNYAGKPPMSSFDRQALRAYVDHGFAPAPTGGVTLKCLPANEAQVYEMAGSSHAYEHLADVACPVVILRGHPEQSGPASFADRIADSLPIGKLEARDDLGHFGPLEDPAGLAVSAQALIDA